MESKQVSKEHYNFFRYMRKSRWISVWHQLYELLSVEPKNALEVGSGSGLFKAIAKSYGVEIKTLDIAEDLNPDYVASAKNMPFDNDSFDAICCFQMLEHLPYEESLDVLSEFNRVASRHIIISLPDSKKQYTYTIYLPKLGVKRFLLNRLFFRPKKHKFDGEHYWEINRQDYLLDKIIDDFSSRLPKFKLIKTYRVHENPYHRFFIYGISN